MMASFLTNRSAAAIRTLQSKTPQLRLLSIKVVNDADVDTEPMPSGYTFDSIKPPKYWAKPDELEEDPNAYKRNPVTSVHAIDLQSKTPQISKLDSVSVTPNGTILHGRYGELKPDDTESIPMEYLALLHPAAEGAAAVRKLGADSKGTVLVYGASEANGLSVVQLAASKGNAVVAVVGGNHSGDRELVDAIKSLIPEPGTVVPEEFAIVKGCMRDLVSSIVKGDESQDWNWDAEKVVQEFRANIVDYAEAYPATRPAALSADVAKFTGKEKDREYWEENMNAYLSQFSQGSPPISADEMAKFDKIQYALFKSKFGKQTTAVITGDKVPDFHPPTIVKNMILNPEKNQDTTTKPDTDFVPYHFNILENMLGNNVDTIKGGPITGAIIAVTPELKTAADAVAKAGKKLRDKAEALQFLTESEKNAFAAAASVAKLAKDAGKPVVVIGGTLPELESVQTKDMDVNEAISAMKIGEDGESRLNYFIQLYRASDFAVYEDYAIHRATEPLAGPRQILVTK
jgi:hypothetical protein